MQVKKEMTCAHSRVLLWKDQGLLYQQAATTSTSNYNYSYKFFASQLRLQPAMYMSVVIPNVPQPLCYRIYGAVSCTDRPR
jgi:hypothetical protein